MTDRIFFWGIIVFLFGTLGIGVWASKQIKGDSVNYLVAGRGLALPLAAATLMAQSVDSNATLGNTDLAAEFGFWAGASLPIGLALCLFLTALFFAKPMNRMGLITLPDFYRVKYNRITEFVASIIMVLSFAFLLAGNLVAGGYLFQTFLGTSYLAGVMLIAIVVFIYTASGGLFAVAYTDAIQVAIALIGTILLVGFLGFNFGMEIPAGTGPFDLAQLTSPEMGAAVNWATLLALGLGDIVAIDFMARVFAAESPETAQRACFIGSAGTVLIGVPFSIIALSSTSILEQAGVTAGEGPLLFAILKDVVPPVLGLIVIAAILSASLSTADGAILGTSSVMAHNILGIRHNEHSTGEDRLLLITRIMAFVITALGVFFAVRVPQTGILLLLAFDLGFAGLLVPLAGGLYWREASWQGALSCILLGTLTRLFFFALMPTAYGIDNTLLYIPNGIFTAAFDGFPTLISPLVGLVAFIGFSKLTGGAEALRNESHFEERQPQEIGRPRLFTRGSNE
ncbi:sodium:solute symporter family protein [Lusitaniella coriacea LEGE 07157]|uniref:Sodium:solute symporter family protein n=1 Tax=Lusitaniella coriacea LEGE 07157 TaxID=945747 RepID=A0A8J7B8Q3_9CYAN|nr:sodium:solute symporter family protein [Lusitaniella coriacea]MBE9114973.1 sodium:solute symporter family protein [Lusitaniella coriacea LEGE 07157]